MRAFLLLATCVPALAAIDPNGLIFEVRQEQKQVSQLNSKTSDGRRDRSIHRVRVLHVSLRYQGVGPSEPAILRWFFIGKSPVDGRFDYYSIGSENILIPRGRTVVIDVVSEPLTQDKYVEVEYRTSIHVTAGSTPHGWVAMVSQGGYVIKQTASDAGLISWMAKNPPPRPKNNP